MKHFRKQRINKPYLSLRSQRFQGFKTPVMMCLRHVILVVLLVMLLACTEGDEPIEAGADTTSNCSGQCADGNVFLTQAEVERIVAQAINEAQARGVAATIAVSDRVGNILAVYRMNGANSGGVLISTTPQAPEAISGGLEGLLVPADGDVAAAISKAITAAYLSSEGNAFSTRTAGQIIQEHFNPGEDNQPSGPLFGVQFSQLACSDLMQAQGDGTALRGPKRAPLGLSADPGGLPLYKQGTVVGGVGVIADGRYSLDKNLLDVDLDQDELIALAASWGFAAPLDRRASRITVEGKTLRFSDASTQDLASKPADAPSFGSISAPIGSVVAVPTYFDGTVRAGAAFAQSSSGIRADNGVFADLGGFVLVDASDNNRYSPRASTTGLSPLTQTEVTQVLRSALALANETRAQIRRPLSTPARVTISVVDAAGTILGIVRGRDAPIFGIDVSLQKARTAAFYSSAQAAAIISSLPDADYLDSDLSNIAITQSIDLFDYVSALRDFLNLPNALSDGAYAFTDRAGGNLARPFFPDGLQDNNHGPLSKPQGQWSPFSTGMQLDLVYNAIAKHVAFLLSGGLDVSVGCAGKSLSASDIVAPALLANGIQIFPGSVPIYRGQQLVGAIGVSGDGVDQDDMIAYLGLERASQALNGAINNAPEAMRADQLAPKGIQLRYVQCPQAPFIDDGAVNVCADK